MFYRKIKTALVWVKAAVSTILVTTLVLLYSLGAVTALAQEEASQVVGKWERLTEMVHVEIKPSSSQDSGVSDGEMVFEGVITRADWSPGRVGRVVYRDLVYSGRNRWSGQEVNDSGKTRRIRLTLKSDGMLHTTSYLDGRQQIRWSPIKSE